MRINSLMCRFNSLLGQNKFPVPVRRELHRKPLNCLLDCEPTGAPRRPRRTKFPVFSQLAGNLGSRDEFAQDCLLQQRVRCEPDFRWGITRNPTTAPPMILFETARRRAGSEIGPGTKTTADAGQHDNAYIRIVIAGAHVFADLGNGVVFLGGARPGATRISRGTDGLQTRRWREMDSNSRSLVCETG